MENVLKKIIINKRENIKKYKKLHSTTSLLNKIKKINNFVDFKSELIKINSEVT